MAVLFTVDVDLIEFGFDWVNQEITVEDTASSITADQLKEAIKLAEQSSLGMIYPDIADFGNPVTLIVGDSATALNVVLLEGWTILTLKSSGFFALKGGNTVSQIGGVEVFSDNPNVTAVNNLTQAGVRVISSGGISPTQQQIRDAMELDSTSGNDNIDSKLDKNFAVSAAQL